MASAQEAAAFAELSRAGTSAMDAAAAILVSREVDLAAWEHEARGAGGKWARGNPVLPPGLRPATAAEISPGHNPAVTALQEKPATMRHLAMVHQQALAVAQDAAKTAAAKAVKQAMDIHNEAERLANDKAGRDARKKFIAIALSLLGGAALGLVTAGLGLPPVAAVLISVSPGLAEAAFEWKNRL